MDQELKLAMEHLHACRDRFARQLYEARKAQQNLSDTLTSMEVASERVIALINVAKKAVE